MIVCKLGKGQMKRCEVVGGNQNRIKDSTGTKKKKDVRREGQRGI